MYAYQTVLAILVSRSRPFPGVDVFLRFTESGLLWVAFRFHAQIDTDDMYVFVFVTGKTLWLIAGS